MTSSPLPHASPLSLKGAHWQLRAPRVDDTPPAMAALSGPAARLVACRQLAVDTTWLSPTMDALHDPFTMRNMGLAIDRLRRAIRDGDRIRVVTDYDVDGTTSSLILQAALRSLSSDVDISYHIPNRFTEGYGFSKAAVDAARADGVDLVVTADIGVRDHATVDHARQSGIDVLICDHHLPDGASVPTGATVLCPPQAGDAYENRSLAACGVSLKVAQALLADHPKRDAIVQSMLKLAAIGTVCDLVPLSTLENRAIVALGLKQLNLGRHNAGLGALLKAAGAEVGRVDARAIGFRVGPRINAAGRLADASIVVRLLSERDPAKAAELARQLDAYNQERKSMQRTLTERALELAGSAEGAFPVLAGAEQDGWHRGIVGIVASRVKDELQRPCAIVSIQGDVAVGSVRSVPGVHAVDALASAGDLLDKFGGHPAAAGFTLPAPHLAALQTRLNAFAEGSDRPPSVENVDFEIDRRDLTEAFCQDLDQLEPHGLGHPRPMLLLRGVDALDVQLRGANDVLLKFTIPTGTGRNAEGIVWSRPEWADRFKTASMDVIGHVGVQEWRGRKTVQFEVSDARPVPGESSPP